MAERNLYVPRVNQIDAIHLNGDITRLIRNKLLENLQEISPTLFAKIQPELDLLIQSAIWFGSVGRQCSTFGQQLLVLSYDPERLTVPRLFLHFMLTIIPRYVKNLDERRLSIRSEWLHRIIEWGENTALLFSVLNFFRFLKTGRQPSFVDFLLGLDYISLRHNQRRDIGYKYLTRELLWGGFMEILGLLLPIINFRIIQRIFKNALKSIHNMTPNSARAHTVEDKLTTMTSNTVCTYCGERPTLPHHMGCGHIYCYYCLSANIFTDANFNCINCGANCTNGIHAV
ncbi:peroxisome biogenesis factor 2 [Anastrepha ludens]|uniref:peroxisome biogenesis factor 2 n=1 Tax=Anastrepha ludens TaxID=28586 RepID=UPI0023B02196|nr:peroxisome biogenesis factor 2 [Anastrepha ludens]